MRVLIVTHLYNWTYAQTKQVVSDNLVLVSSVGSMPKRCQTIPR